MATNPIEVSYQLGRNVYCMRVEMTASATPTVYNAVSHAYETYNAANWANYAIAVAEVMPGYYRAVCPPDSLAVPATEIFFERQGGSPAAGDAPPIANGNSQGANIATVNGVISDAGGLNPSAIVDICNLALTHLGQRKITTLSDNTQAARLCNQIFNNNRDEVLRGASWKFATVLAALTQLASEDVIGWSYVYTFPTDCVYVRKVYSDDTFDLDFASFPTPVPFSPITNPPGVDFRVVYQPDLHLTVIVANVNPAYIEYTGRIIDPTLYDSLFIKALSLKLAAELSPGLNGDTAQRKELWMAYNLAMSEAAKANGNEDGTPNRKKSNYVDVR